MTSSWRGRGGQAQVDACGWGRRSAPCALPHKELVPTDVILSTSHVEKLKFFCFRISFLHGIKSGHFLSM